MNIIHMDLRVHRGSWGPSPRKRPISEGKERQNAKKKPPEWGAAWTARGAEILAEVTGERAEGVG